MVDATVSKTVGHNARAGSTPALGTKANRIVGHISHWMVPIGGLVTTKSGEVVTCCTRSINVVRLLDYRSGN